MRVATWNVTSVKQRVPRLLPWLDERRPEIVCLQETKLTDEAFEALLGDELAARGYELALNGSPQWNGVAILSRVVVVGVCMGADRIRPAMAINKEIDLRFVIGYTPIEFRDTLHMLAEGKVNAAPLVTGSVGLEGVDKAFAALGDPAAHAKILVDPKSSAAAP